MWQGYRGDGFRGCVACGDSTTCVCGPGTYYDARSGTCVACRVCPLLATTLGVCAYGATADTVCYCPPGYYLHPLHPDTCVPCAACGGNSTVLDTCAVPGLTTDVSRCACRNGTVDRTRVGNGLVCF